MTLKSDQSHEDDFPYLWIVSVLIEDMVQSPGDCEGEDGSVDLLLCLGPPVPPLRQPLLQVTVVGVDVTAGHRLAEEEDQEREVGGGGLHVPVQISGQCTPPDKQERL